MCIIIDTNCFANVFNKTSARHNEFVPVLKWIISGKGKVVYGGTKYIEELKKASKYMKIFSLMNMYNCAIHIEDQQVDHEQVYLETNIVDPNFDDPHLMAIVLTSGCRLICSEDDRSIPFVTNTRLYPRRISKPKYYKGLRQVQLLCDNNIPPRYRPLCIRRNGHSPLDVLV